MLQSTTPSLSALPAVLVGLSGTVAAVSSTEEHLASTFMVALGMVVLIALAWFWIGFRTTVVHQP